MQPWLLWPVAERRCVCLLLANPFNQTVVRSLNLKQCRDRADCVAAIRIKSFQNAINQL
jgi:hypothetical protein